MEKTPQTRFRNRQMETLTRREVEDAQLTGVQQLIERTGLERVEFLEKK